MIVKPIIFTVTLQAKKNVRHFLEYHYGNPIKIPNDCHLNFILKGLLMRPLKRLDKKKLVAEYSETINVAISQYEFRNSGFDVSKHGTIIFNKCVDTMMKERIIDKTEAHIDRGLNIKDSIILAREQMHMNEDLIPYETLKQFYFRRRKNFNSLNP